jgi:peptide/nickel transport system ATP-binding protein
VISGTLSNVVSVRDLEVSYRSRHGETAAVRGISFTIAAGEAYGLVGESGSGKTTAAMTLTRYLPDNAELRAAELSVAGTDVLGLEGQALRRFRASTFGIVYQEPGLALNPTMTVGAQIAEVYRLTGQDRHQARASTLAAIARVGLAPAEVIIKRFPHELSGGQQQRIVIAMALAVQPALLILDEPTTGLDSRVETEIMALIDGLQAELGFASLMISHNLPLIAAHCRRVGVLQRGVLVEEGSASDILQTPRHPYTRALVTALPDVNANRRPASARVSVGLQRSEPAGLPDRPLLTVEHLTKSYHHRAALRDVSFTIGRGEALGIVGESGAGKSTLGRSVAGLASYDGSIEFDVGPPAGRREQVPNVQLVFQNADASLNPRRTVRQVLSRSIKLLRGDQSAEELAESTGLAPVLLDRLPHQLSGGEKQRVAIARAFAGRVPLVICDEPTSALDVSIQARILDLLVELQERTSVSYLFISHDLAVVRQISHRIGVLYDGELVELGPAEQIFDEAQHPYTRSLVESAVALRRAPARV